MTQGQRDARHGMGRTHRQDEGQGKIEIKLNRASMPFLVGSKFSSPVFKMLKRPLLLNWKPLEATFARFG